MLQSFLIICLVIGAGYTIVGFFLGELEIGDFGDSSGAVSPLKPSVIAAFLTAFGGVGLIMLPRLHLVGALSVAAASALVTAFAFHRILTALYKAQNTSAVERQSLIGHSAVVTETVPQGGGGKISFFISGNTHAAPAKSEDGSPISRKAPVEIVYIEKNTYYVRRK